MLHDTATAEPKPKMRKADLRCASRGPRSALTVGGVAIGTVVAALLLYRHVPVDQLFFARATLLVVAAELLTVAILLRHRVIRGLNEFFTAASSPVNLAIFRIVVFWRIYREVELASIIPYTHIAAGLLVPPWGTGPLLPFFSLNQDLVRVCVTSALIFSVMGMLGLFARFSALACAILCFYVLGIPQLCGKVDHYHHLVWFATLLALSPCADVLAIDAVLAARKTAGTGITSPPPKSRIYALPLRFAMILLGLIYFFPGFWKLWESGFKWLQPQNLNTLLHQFWTWSYDMSWVPGFRIDHHPVLCGLGAAATIVFETTFIFLVFFPKLRVAAAGGGVLFHNLTNQFMNISFFSLQESYAALLEWELIFGWIGRRLYPVDMLFIYDGGCSRCRRTVASLRVLDVLGRVSYLDDAEHSRRARAGLDSHSAAATIEGLSHVLAITGGRRRTGFRAYRALFSRIAVCWPLLPFFWLPGVAGVGEKLRRHGRETGQLAQGTATNSYGSRVLQLRAVAVAGAILVAASLFCGFGKIVTGWPVACYPTFSSPPQRELTAVRLVANMPDGNSVRVGFKGIAYHRLYWMLMRALPGQGGSIDRDRLKDFWTLAVRNDPSLGSATAVVFYRDVLWTDPELWQSNPKDQQAFYKLQTAPCPAGPTGTPPAACDQLPQMSALGLRSIE